MSPFSKNIKILKFFQSNRAENLHTTVLNDAEHDANIFITKFQDFMVLLCLRNIRFYENLLFDLNQKVQEIVKTLQ